MWSSKTFVTDIKSIKSGPVGMAGVWKWIGEFTPIHAVWMNTGYHGELAAAIRVYISVISDHIESGWKQQGKGESEGEEERGGEHKHLPVPWDSSEESRCSVQGGERARAYHRGRENPQGHTGLVPNFATACFLWKGHGRGNWFIHLICCGLMYPNISRTLIRTCPQK